MKWVKRITLLLIALAVLFWAVFFGIENTMQVPLSLVFFNLPSASLSIWIVAAFISGAVLAVLLIYSMVVKQKSRYLVTKRQLQQCQQKLANSKLSIPGD